MVEKQKDSISVEKNQNNLSIKINRPVQFELSDTTNNRKALYVLLRLLKTENSKYLTTFRAISALFGLQSRQDSNNFYREFQACGEDLFLYLKRKKALENAFPLREKQVLEMPLLSIPEQFKKFSDGLWWTFVTFSTTGYGDKVPITIGGRIVALITILTGLGIVSFLSGIRSQDSVSVY